MSRAELEIEIDKISKRLQVVGIEDAELEELLNSYQTILTILKQWELK